ncbi:MAG: sigma-B regulation protein RsbU (phosphoserine phosphatase) [Planctomycetota bacterium]|jgi:sigma-B regulation protein RsbU (phosphoserine phosphatase)
MFWIWLGEKPRSASDNTRRVETLTLSLEFMGRLHSYGCRARKSAFLSAADTIEDLTAHMSFRLTIYVSDSEVGVQELKIGTSYVVGRESKCDVVVPERSVSRRHCELSVTSEGVLVKDLGSANGLVIAGQQEREFLLRDGASVCLGNAHLKVTRPVSHTGMIPITGLQELITAGGGPAEDPMSSVHSWSESSSIDSRSSFDREIGLDATSGKIPSPKEFTDSSASISLQSGANEYKSMAKERLALLVDTGKSLGQSSNLEDLLQRIIDHLFEILQVKRAVIALTDDGINFVPSKVMPAREEGDLSAIASQSIMRDVASSKKGKIFDDAASDQRINSNMSIIISNIRAAICAPIMFNNRCLGAIYADYPTKRGLYTNADLEFLTAFASIAAVSLENSRMVHELRTQDRLRRDMQVAGDIQKGLLPQEGFEFDFMEVDWAYWPSARVGGDFFDVLELDDGRIAAVLGDVSGKSVPAAIYMARTLSILRATITAFSDPGEAMTRTNALLGETDGIVLFATTFIMVFDPETRIMSWCSAGHNPVLVRDPDTGEYAKLGALENAIPIGVLPSVQYETCELQLKPGNFISIYTDGLVEARNKDAVEYGLANVYNLIDTHFDGPLTETTQAMLKAIQAHIKDSPYIRDDVCILNLRIM